ncbi:MAG: hypothetical protein IJU37_10390 [Desulfovibrio sp.]|jgi:hypothetical protein|nr:hypothetical protein [Desulfovibrio sp.]
MRGQKNSYGLYDEAVRSKGVPTIVMTPEMLDRQIANGAFFMTPEEAINANLLSPIEAQDAVRVVLRRAD